MSYEVILLPCPAELDGDDAVEWLLDHEDTDDELELSPSALAAWGAVVDAAAQVLPGGETAASSEHSELSWPDLGIILEYWPDEVTINVAFWHEGAAGTAVVEAIYELASIVESCTGLRAFDPQLGLLLADASAGTAADVYRRAVTLARTSPDAGLTRP